MLLEFYAVEMLHLGINSWTIECHSLALSIFLFFFFHRLSTATCQGLTVKLYSLDGENRGWSLRITYYVIIRHQFLRRFLVPREALGDTAESEITVLILSDQYQITGCKTRCLRFASTFVCRVNVNCEVTLCASPVR